MKIETEVQNVNNQADNNIVHENGFRKTDSLTAQPLDACPQCQVFAFDSLSVTLSYSVLILIEVTFITAPVVSIEHGNPKGLQKGLQFPENSVLPLPECISQNSMCVVVDGKPKPMLSYQAV